MYCIFPVIVCCFFCVLLLLLCIGRVQLSLIRGQYNSCLGNPMLLNGTTASSMNGDGHKFKNSDGTSRQMYVICSLKYMFDYEIYEKRVKCCDLDSQSSDPAHVHWVSSDCHWLTVWRNVSCYADWPWVTPCQISPLSFNLL